MLSNKGPENQRKRVFYNANSLHNICLECNWLVQISDKLMKIITKILIQNATHTSSHLEKMKSKIGILIAATRLVFV